jgi:hypothetical protein
MVMIGHSERLATPLSRRQRRTMALVLGGVLALVIAAIVIATVSSDAQRSANGCVYAVVASSMGAGQLHKCGAPAREWCASLVGGRDAQARIVLPECRRAGYPTSGPAPKP